MTLIKKLKTGSAAALIALTTACSLPHSSVDTTPSAYNERPYENKMMRLSIEQAEKIRRAARRTNPPPHEQDRLIGPGPYIRGYWVPIIENKIATPTYTPTVTPTATPTHTATATPMPNSDLEAVLGEKPSRVGGSYRASD